MIRFFLSLFVLNFFAAGAYAQTGIVAVVNDDVISKLDYEQRLAFVKAVGGLDVSKKENKERMLRLMIDEIKNFDMQVFLAFMKVVHKGDQEKERRTEKCS